MGFFRTLSGNQRSDMKSCNFVVSSNVPLTFGIRPLKLQARPESKSTQSATVSPNHHCAVLPFPKPQRYKMQ